MNPKYRSYTFNHCFVIGGGITVVKPAIEFQIKCPEFQDVPMCVTVFCFPMSDYSSNCSHALTLRFQPQFFLFSKRQFYWYNFLPWTVSFSTFRIPPNALTSILSIQTCILLFDDFVKYMSKQSLIYVLTVCCIEMPVLIWRKKHWRIAYHRLLWDDRWVLFCVRWRVVLWSCSVRFMMSCQRFLLLTKLLFSRFLATELYN